MPSDLDELCRMIGATKRSERKNVQEVINNPKLFSVDGIHLVQKMCDETLDSIAHTRETNSQSAKSRWNKNNNLDDANALPAQSERNANYKLESNNYKKLAGAKNEKEKNPEFCDREILPYDWQTYAESKNIPNEQIFRSWERFKSTSKAPWMRLRWQRWVDREITEITHPKRKNEAYGYA